MGRVVELESQLAEGRYVVGDGLGHEPQAHSVGGLTVVAEVAPDLGHALVVVLMLQDRLDQLAILVHDVVSRPDLTFVEGRPEVGVEELDHERRDLGLPGLERGLTHVAGVDGDQVVHVRVGVEGLVVDGLELAEELPLQPGLLAHEVLEGVGAHAHEVGVPPDLRARRVPLQRQEVLAPDVAHSQGPHRVHGPGRDDLVVVGHGGYGHVGELLDRLQDRDLRALGVLEGSGRDLDRAVSNPRHDALGVEEVEHVDEVGDHQEEAQGHGQDRDHDRDLGQEPVPDRQADVDRHDAAHDEEPEHDDVRLLL